MRVAVTGGAGFIGSAVCDELVARGAADVVAVDDLSTGNRANLRPAAVPVAVGSVLDEDFLTRTLAGLDAVVHLAALTSVPRSLRDPLAFQQVNVAGTVRVLQAARAAGAYVLVASSSSVYGRAPGLPQHESAAPRPASPYAASKLAAESYALAYQHSFGLPTLAARLFNVFGPRQVVASPYAAIVPRLIAAALGNATVEIYGDGRQTRDFTYVGSVARVLCDAVCGRVVHDEPVNLAFGGETSVLDLAGLVGEIAGRPPRLVFVPGRAGEVRRSRADPGVLSRLFPEARPLDLRAALAETVEWYASAARSDRAVPMARPRPPGGRRDRANTVSDGG